MRPRRSRYRLSKRFTGVAPVAIIAAILLLAVGGALFAARLSGLIAGVTGSGVSLGTVTNGLGITEPPAGSIAYRLKHKDPTPINLLVLGYGGAENDAPYLTDTLMVLRLDPASNRVAMISVPRDLYLPIEAWPSSTGIAHTEKINAAFLIGTDNGGYPDAAQRSPRYTGRDGGGHLAEDTVAKVTGLHFDGYAAVDFKAFRTVVDALGGVNVCLSSPLDDYNYPNYSDGYIPGGIHFKAGCQHVNGEQALEIARSRDAVELNQQSDFARAQRQQQIVAAIKKQMLTVNGFTKLPGLMSALSGNFKTDLTIDDLSAIYSWSKGVDESKALHYGLTNANLLTVGGCGPGYAGYILCPVDPSYQMVHAYIADTFPPPLVTSAKAPVQVAWGGYPADLGSSVSNLLTPYGFKLASPQNRVLVPQATVIYDFSGGLYPQTQAFLAQFFKAQVVTVTASTPAPAAFTNNQGFVIDIGHDFGRRWYNCGASAC
ncbi:MAG TPA: LCP family protein [Candidatus Dormibacteraeota bacterium]|nr:LCP family protein [Candidatus Dormibacteraeota bacterium]